MSPSRPTAVGLDLESASRAAPPAAVRASRTRPASQGRLPADLLDAGIVTGLATVLVVLVLRLWEAAPKIPLSYPGPWSRDFFAGDASGPLMLARSLEQGQWWSRPNPNLGAPFGQDLRDFPQGPDHFHIAVLKGLVELLGDPFAATNAYYLLGYVLVALSAWAVLRLMGISRPAAVVVGVLFTFLPYHGGKGPEHLFLANYFAVPFGGLLLHWHLTGRTAWGPARRPGARGLTGRRLGGLLLMALLLGSASAYYALHLLVLLAVVVVLQVLARRDWRPLLSGVLITLPVLATLLLNSLPALLFAARNGPSAGLARTPEQSWYFGMNLSQLLMPVLDHRLDVLADLARAHRLASGFQEPGHTLGLIGSVTLLALAVVLVRRVLLGRTAGRWRARLRERQAGLAVLAALIATAGGGSLVIALFGFGEARVWARMSIYIAFFVLCALATWLDDALDWWRRRGARTWTAWPVLAGLLLFGVWEQTSPKDVPSYDAIQVAFDSDYAFMRQAYDRLGEGALVWQLPQVSFPEGGLRVGEMYDYDLVKGYLHAPELRWSYGALKSRPAGDWQSPVSRQPVPEQLSMVVAAGFSAVYLDTFGLPRAGRPLIDELRSLLGQEPIVSDDRRLALFDLRPFAARLERAVGPQVLQVAGANVLQRRFGSKFGAGFRQAEVIDLDGRWAKGTRAELILTNPGDRAVPIELHMLVGSDAGDEHTFRVEGPGVRKSMQISQAQRPFRARFLLPPGETALQLFSDAPLVPNAEQERRFFVNEVVLIGPELRQVRAACAPRLGGGQLQC